MNLDDVNLNGIGDLVLQNGLRLLLIAILAVVGFRILDWLISLLSKRIQQLDGEDDSEFDLRIKTIFRFVRSVGLIAIGVVTLLLVLGEIGIDTTPIVASVGVLGLAVGLGAQTLVKDAISGVFVLFEDQYHVGDTLKVNGLSGTVEALNLRTTHLRDLAGTLHIIPNGEIRTVSNMSRGWARAVVEVVVPYSENVDYVLETIREVLVYLETDKEFKDMLDGELSVTGIEGFDERGIKFRILGKVQPGMQWAVMRIIRRRVVEAFGKRDIRFGMPTSRVQRVKRANTIPEEMPQEVEPLYEGDYSAEYGDEESDHSLDIERAKPTPFNMQVRLNELRRWANENVINPDD